MEFARALVKRTKLHKGNWVSSQQRKPRRATKSKIERFSPYSSRLKARRDGGPHLLTSKGCCWDLCRLPKVERVLRQAVRSIDATQSMVPQLPICWCVPPRHERELGIAEQPANRCRNVCGGEVCMPCQPLQALLDTLIRDAAELLKLKVAPQGPGAGGENYKGGRVREDKGEREEDKRASFGGFP
jgi:hypothetical protein